MRAALRGFSLLQAKDKLRYLLAIFAKLVLVGLDLVGLLFIGLAANLLLQANFSPKSMGFVTNLAHSFGISNIYAFVAAVAAGFFIAKAVFSLLLNYLTAKFLARVESELSARLFRGFLRLGLGKQARWSQNQVIQGVQDGAYNAFSASLITTSIIAGETALIISVSILLFATNPLLFVLTAAYLGTVAWLVSAFINSRTKAASQRLREISFKTWNTLGDMQESYRQVFLSPKITQYSERFRAARLQHSFQQAKISILQYIPRYVLEAALMIGIGLVLVQRSFDGGRAFPLDQVAIFFAGVFRMVGALLPLVGASATLKQIEVESAIAFELVEELKGLDYEDAPASKSPPRSYAIKIENLSYRYKDSKKSLLNGLDLQIKEGSFVSIQGKSGAGKSTLADLLLGLREPESGKVLIGGIAPRAFQTKFPAAIAYVPQRTHLLNGTFVENITMDFNRKNNDDEEVNLLIEKLDLSDVISNLPNGLATDMGSGKVQLSGGQLQRVGIARALYSRPRLLILDEITSALDPKTELLIDQCIQDLKGKTTVISIAHRKSKVLKFNQVIKLS